jgi:hypothetical protein
VLVVVTVLAALGFWAVFDVAGARAVSTICADPAVPASGTYDTLVVPAGESCRLDGLTIVVRRNLVLEPGTFLIGGGNQPTHLTVGGNVLAKSGAAFIFDQSCECSGNPSTLAIGRNLIGSSARAVSVSTGTIGGNVLVFGATLQALLSNLSVGHNLVVEGSTAPNRLVLIAFNTVGGQLLDLNNRLVPSGFNLVEGNTVSGNLICEGNDPAPFFDVQIGPNLVFGKALGQCAGL